MTSATDGWFYERNGAPDGPHSAEEIISLFRLGSIIPSTRVWHQSLPEWVAFASSGLQSEPANAAPPPLPPQDAGDSPIASDQPSAPTIAGLKDTSLPRIFVEISFFPIVFIYGGISVLTVKNFSDLNFRMQLYKMTTDEDAFMIVQGAFFLVAVISLGIFIYRTRHNTNLVSSGRNFRKPFAAVILSILPIIDAWFLPRNLLDANEVMGEDAAEDTRGFIMFFAWTYAASYVAGFVALYFLDSPSSDNDIAWGLNADLASNVLIAVSTLVLIQSIRKVHKAQKSRIGHPG